ncbi:MULTISPECIES: type VI secretion system baseplate subunit TssG [unclassified Acinetobacter]|uniref:type VI secretion system baseplate subunit TssG n=1 Tax=unclassified Acinetobacter TaxID=196816 RepID=UPI0015D3DC8D|nr:MULTISPECIES: type VI secretion system baseplate subunit TssG [unclassified Acinetobacter]
MRAERWWQESSVIDGLFQEPKAYEFVQATRLLRHAPYGAAQVHWANDFEFNSSLNLNFPNTEIESLEFNDEKVELTNLMVGLTGIQGALPYSYTNKIKLSGRHQRHETQKFLGLFNHKLTAHYVDASLNYHLPIRYEIEQDNHYLDILHALNGYIRSQHDQPDLDDYFAEFSGLMQGQNNTAYALKTMLNCIFKQNFDIREFIPETFVFEEDQRTCLGGSQPSLLGLNTFCGEKIQQIDEKIEIVIGPLNHEDYLTFLPNQSHSQKLKQMIQTWCSPTLMVDVRLILQKEEIKPVCLNSLSGIGLAQGAFLQPNKQVDNTETCYALMGNS